MTEKIVGILAGILILGIIALLVLDKDTQIIIPLATLLIGYLIKGKEGAILGVFKKQK